MRNDWIETLARASAGLPESRGPDPLALIDPQGGGQLIPAALWNDRIGPCALGD
jgi:hypothetical protein